jgi:superfamily I DNA/RNA helicase
VQRPATLLLESAWRRHPWPFPHTAGQLPNLASGPNTGRPAVGPRGVRGGRHYGGTGRYRLVFNGPIPVIRVLDSLEEEREAVSTRLSDRSSEGVESHEIGVFVRSPAELARARAAVEDTGLRFKVLDENVETTSGHISVSTMYLAKGLEFRAVVVMACDDEVIPLQDRIETVADEADLAEVYDTERHLLYVACTRARGHLLVTSGDSPSEFLDDLRM